MKSSTKILIGVIVAITFLIGFFIGMTVSKQRADKQDLAGTIGLKGNAKDIAETIDHANLLAEILTDESLLKSYNKYFAFHLNGCKKLNGDVDFALKSFENAPEFVKSYSAEIDKFKQLQNVLEQAVKDINAATSFLQQLSQAKESDFDLAIKNANNSISQVKENQKAIQDIVSAIEKFMLNNNPYKFSGLVQAHDLFSINSLNVTP